MKECWFIHRMFTRFIVWHWFWSLWNRKHRDETVVVFIIIIRGSEVFIIAHLSCCQPHVENLLSNILFHFAHLDAVVKEICNLFLSVPGPPADIKILVLSSSSLLVSWKKPEHSNGELLYYTVYVKPTSR